MGLRDRLRRLERRSEDEIVTVAQPDGPPARFPQSALREAFLINVRRLCGEDVPEHPLSIAAARSGDTRWLGSFVAHAEVSEEVVPDLSE